MRGWIESQKYPYFCVCAAAAQIQIKKKLDLEELQRGVSVICLALFVFFVVVLVGSKRAANIFEILSAAAPPRRVERPRRRVIAKSRVETNQTRACLVFGVSVARLFLLCFLLLFLLALLLLCAATHTKTHRNVM